MSQLGEVNARLIKSVYRSLLKVCKTYDEFPIYKVTLPNPSHTKSPTLMTRSWTKTSIGSDVLSKVYHENQSYIGLFYANYASFVNICRQAFRDKENSKNLDEAFEVAFGCMSELNIHQEALKKQNKEHNIGKIEKINNIINPPSQVPVKREIYFDEEAEEEEEERIPFSKSKEVLINKSVTEAMEDMKNDQHLINIVENNSYNEELLNNSDIHLVLTNRPRKNHLLVAHPLLADTHFERTVVRMDDNIGRLGYIIGKRYKESDKEEEESEEKRAVKEAAQSAEAAEDFQAFYDKLLKTFKIFDEPSKDDKRWRLASWAPDQLKNELIDGKWIVVEADMDSFLPFAEVTPCHKVWEYVLQRLGGEFNVWKDFYTNEPPKQQQQKKDKRQVRVHVLFG
ncbi:hypothetical protein ABK040_011389 [Willaertia magna]